MSRSEKYNVWDGINWIDENGFAYIEPVKESENRKVLKCITECLEIVKKNLGTDTKTSLSLLMKI